MTFVLLVEQGLKGTVPPLRELTIKEEKQTSLYIKLNESRATRKNKEKFLLTVRTRQRWHPK